MTRPHVADELAQILQELVAYLRRFVVLSDPQVVATALWVAHTYAFDAAEATPYLQITSPEKRSGKSTLLDVLERVVTKPWKVVATTEAALFRVIEDRRPTVLLDEYDTILYQEQGTRRTSRDLERRVPAGNTGSTGRRRRSRLPRAGLRRVLPQGPRRDR